MVAWGAMPFGSLAAGYLLEPVGPRGAVLALAGFTTLVAVIGTASPGIRRAAVLASR
jgi:hypothetical protein